MRVFYHRIVLVLASLSAAVVIAACSQPAEEPVEEPAAPAESEAPLRTELDPVERGRLLIHGGGCHDCHTTKNPDGTPDMTQMLGGHPQDIIITAPFQPREGEPWFVATNATLTAWSGPWGVSFAPNLTSDPTGLNLTQRNFVIALKTGAHLGTARPILPPMPWTEYRNLPDEDLEAMWSYLQSIPPIANRVPEPLPPAAQ